MGQIELEDPVNNNINFRGKKSRKKLEKTCGESITQEFQDQTTNLQFPIFVYFVAKKKQAKKLSKIAKNQYFQPNDLVI